MASKKPLKLCRKHKIKGFSKVNMLIKEMIEKTAQEFQKLNGDNQMFILGYMLGIQQERQRTTPQPQTA